MNLLAKIFGSSTGSRAKGPGRGGRTAGLRTANGSGALHQPISSGAAKPRATAMRPGASDEPLVKRGELRFAPGKIESIDELSAIVLHSVINQSLGLSQHLYYKVAIAQVSASAKRVMLLLAREKVTSDEIEAILQLLARHGYSLVEQGPQAYDVSVALIMPLSSGDISQDRLLRDRSLNKDQQKSSLFSTFVEIVGWAYANNADDIDFAINVQTSHSQICFKIGGKYLRPARWLLLTDTLLQMMGIAWQKSGGGASPSFLVRAEQQALINIDIPKTSALPKGARVRLRWSSMPNDKGTVVTLRIQRLGESSRIRSLKSAGYVPSHIEAFKRVIHSEGGLVIFSGVVGSGKSTSLAQLLEMLPTDIKVVTFEDPVELELSHAYQKTISRDLFSRGADDAFVAATRALYRSALDAFLIGEIRDADTGLVARQVMESGHSVYTTVHARSGLGIIERLCSPAIGIPRDVLGAPDALKLLVYQALLPTNCQKCCVNADTYSRKFLHPGPTREAFKAYVDRIERLYGFGGDRLRFRDPDGCEVCRKPELAELNGYEGRTVVAEVIEPDEEMLVHIQSGNSIELRRAWRSRATDDYVSPDMEGRTAMECAIYKAAHGLIDPREIEPRFTSFETEERKRQIRSGPRRIREVVARPAAVVNASKGGEQ